MSCASESFPAVSTLLGLRLTILWTLCDRQEMLVTSYVEDANARRQFEDAAALQASLDELRAEIAAISATLP